MSEPIWCNVQIRIPESWNVEVCDPNGKPTGEVNPPWFIADLGDALLNGEQPDEVRYMNVVDGQRVEVHHPGCWQTTGEGNYGLGDSDVDTVLEICRMLRVPYIAVQDSKYEFDGELQIHDGSSLWYRTCNEGGVVMTRSDWEALTRQPQDTEIRDGLEIVTAIEDWWQAGMVEIQDLPIDHLPAVCPDRDDCECSGERAWIGDEIRHSRPCPIHPDAVLVPAEVTS
jgi:hypothetical protein